MKICPELGVPRCATTSESQDPPSRSHSSTSAACPYWCPDPHTPNLKPGRSTPVTLCHADDVHGLARRCRGLIPVRLVCAAEVYGSKRACARAVTHSLALGEQFCLHCQPRGQQSLWVTSASIEQAAAAPCHGDLSHCRTSRSGGRAVTCSLSQTSLAGLRHAASPRPASPRIAS